MLTFGNLIDLVDLKRRDVRLLRHHETRPGKPTPYVLWRDHRDRFDAYQATQAFRYDGQLRVPYWASFVAMPGLETLFVGIYSASLVGPLPADRIHPISGEVEPAGSCSFYHLQLQAELSEYAGRLWIEWGPGYRSWVQRGDSREKPVVELRRNLGEDPFPGFQALILNLSEVEVIPSSWRAALAATRGVYLLTCPRTKEQYVGSASGVDGFLGRWREYVATGHGGNVELKSRDPSDYQVSILETVGTGATVNDIIAVEVRWKDKLQSRAMGLNRN